MTDSPEHNLLNDPQHSQWLNARPQATTLSPGLYVVATPIGNLKDITLRALEVLQSVDVIYCEDTRVTQKLLSAYGLKKPLLRSDAHTESSRTNEILLSLKNGERVALVSDAGTPAISDPGAMLVHAAREEGLPVWPVPGASSLTAAFSASGIVAPAITFLGFLPVKSKARKAVLTQWQSMPTALVFFESTQRIEAALADIATVMPDRIVVIMREITKKFEQFYSGLAGDIASRIVGETFKGEVVLMINPPGQDDSVPDDDMVNDLLRGAMSKMFTKDAVAHVAEKTGLPRKDIYKRAIDLNDQK